jgi:hypothetical protein
MRRETVKKEVQDASCRGSGGYGVIIRLDRMIQMGYPPLLICQDRGIEGVDQDYFSILEGMRIAA